MIKEAINKLQDLFQDANAIEQTEINGSIYTERNFRRVDKYIPKCELMNFSNLQGLVENIKANILNEKHELPLSIVVNERSVEIFSAYDEYKNREYIFRSTSQNPEITFNRYVSVEEMIIMLQTCFQVTENRDNLIKLIGNLSKEQSVELQDDGMSQRVVTKDGVVNKGYVTVPPLVKLIPQRTFYEVKQPEQMFLIRISNRCEVALFDAAGGAWKHDCTEAIREYLAEQLEKLIDNQSVIIC